VRLEPGNPLHYGERGFLLRRRGMLDRAIADYGKALELKPDAREAYYHRGRCYHDKGEYARAVADFTELVRLDPTNAEPYNRRAMARCLSGDRAGAIADHSRALELAPQDAATHNALAWLLATSPEDQLRDGRRALELAETACDLTHWENASFLDTLAAAHAECGQFDEAARWVGQALALVPEEGRAEYRARQESYRAGKPFRSSH